MGVPILRLNLVPPPTLWRQHHRTLSWACLLAGSLALAIVGTVSALAYREAIQAGRQAVNSAEEARTVVREQMTIQARLQSVDVEKELPVWRLAERILSERSLPWSRLTAELERSLVQDVRLRSIQRSRDAALSVEVKIRGEAKTREAEEAFITSLQQNPFFAQTILEREADRQGGGVDFECRLPVSETPLPFVTLPKYGPPRPLPLAGPAPAQAPGKPAATPPAPAPAPVKPSANSPAPAAHAAPPPPPSPKPVVRPPSRILPASRTDAIRPEGEARP